MVYWVVMLWLFGDSQTHNSLPLSPSLLSHLSLTPPPSLTSLPTSPPSLPPSLTLSFPLSPSPSLTLSLPQFVALLAFAITAGFNSGATSNSITCVGRDSLNNTRNFTAYATFGYPYSAGSFNITPAPNQNLSNININACMVANSGYTTQVFSTSAEFYVAMGVVTMLYVVGALLIYMLFITPDLFMAKWLVIGVSTLTTDLTAPYII